MHYFDNRDSSLTFFAVQKTICDSFGDSKILTVTHHLSMVVDLVCFPLFLLFKRQFLIHSAIAHNLDNRSSSQHNQQFSMLSSLFAVQKTICGSFSDCTILTIAHHHNMINNSLCFPLSLRFKVILSAMHNHDHRALPQLNY